MKSLFVLSIITSVVFTANAQILQEKSFLLPDSSMLSYLTNQNKKSGLYTIKKSKSEIARGNYVDDKRVGNWYFFNKDKTIFLRYNYDSNKLLFVDDKTLAIADVVILSEDEDVKRKANVSMPIFSLEQYVVLAAIAAVKFIPEKDKLSLNKKEINLVAKVSEKGTAAYFAKYVLNNKSYEIKLPLNDYVEIQWIPASYNNKNYQSEFIIKTPIDFGGKKEGLHRRFNWL